MSEQFNQTAPKAIVVYPILQNKQVFLVSDWGLKLGLFDDLVRSTTRNFLKKTGDQEQCNVFLRQVDGFRLKMFSGKATILFEQYLLQQDTRMYSFTCGDELASLVF